MRIPFSYFFTIEKSKSSKVPRNATPYAFNAGLICLQYAPESDVCVVVKKLASFRCWNVTPLQRLKPLLNTPRDVDYETVIADLGLFSELKTGEVHVLFKGTNSRKSCACLEKVIFFYKLRIIWKMPGISWPETLDKMYEA